jgi:hypothetical protein
MDRAREEEGQAAVELVALLPLLAVIALTAWQAFVTGQAYWVTGVAAREAARARALGADPLAAARAVVAGALRPGVRVRTDGDAVGVRVAIPMVMGRGRLGTAGARARMEPQS